MNASASDILPSEMSPAVLSILKVLHFRYSQLARTRSRLSLQHPSHGEVLTHETDLQRMRDFGHDPRRRDAQLPRKRFITEQFYEGPPRSELEVGHPCRSHITIATSRAREAIEDLDVEASGRSQSEAGAGTCYSSSHLWQAGRVGDRSAAGVDETSGADLLQLPALRGHDDAYAMVASVSRSPIWNRPPRKTDRCKPSRSESEHSDAIAG